MKKQLYAVLLGLAGLLPVSLFGTPLPGYPVEVKAECPTPEAAAAAELKFLELPEGKKVAFSARWDDSSDRHLLMRELMKKHGYKATFYLHDTGRKEFWEKVFPALIADGFTVGDHTWGHRELPQLTPRGIHYEILGWKIRLEQRSNQPVTAFVLPYGKFNSRFFQGVPELIGCSLHRAGILGGPDFSPEIHRHYGLKENEFFGSLLVRPGDLNTRPEKFDADVERHLKAAAGKPVPGFLACHIPLWEFAYLRTYPQALGAAGEMSEPYNLGALNSGALAAFVQRGDIKAVCCGHTHCNTCAGDYCGIKLCSVGSAGYSAYGEDALRGGRVIDLNAENPGCFTTRMVYFDNLFQ